MARAPFKLKSGNTTPFKNMASSTVQQGDSPVKQWGWLAKKAIQYAPGVTKYVKGVLSKGDEVGDVIKKVKKTKTKKVTVKPKAKKTTAKKTTAKKTKPVDHTKRQLDIKVKPKTKTKTKTKTTTQKVDNTPKPGSKEAIRLELEALKKQKSIVQQGKDVGKSIGVGVLKGGATVGAWEGGKWVLGKAFGGQENENENTTVPYAPNNVYTVDGDTLNTNKFLDK